MDSKKQDELPKMMHTVCIHFWTRVVILRVDGT